MLKILGWLAIFMEMNVGYVDEVFRLPSGWY